MTDNLITHLNDRRAWHTFSYHGMKNTPAHFKLGDKVCILTGGIDSFGAKKFKAGMYGYIDNIMHRYVGEPVEHREYWITAYHDGEPIGRSRWNINDILPSSIAMELFNNHQQHSGQFSNET